MGINFIFSLWPSSWRLRTEIYEPGDSRDVNISIEKFLGRPRSLEPFLKEIGIGKSATDDKR